MDPYGECHGVASCAVQHLFSFKVIALFVFNVNNPGSPAWSLASALVTIRISISSQLMSLAADIFVLLDGEPGENWAKDTVAVVCCSLGARSLEFSDELERLGWSKTKPGNPWG